MNGQHPALVLNADYQPLSYFPLSTWSFEHTMKKVLRPDPAVVVVEEYDTVMRSSSLAYRPPSVIALKHYVPPPKTVPFTRFNLFLRDRFTCQYCGHGFRANDLTFDHVVPRCFGGGTNWLNIVAACHPCNGKKCNKRLMKPLRQPYEPSAHELTAVKRTLPPNHLHQTWVDYLYWDVALERSGEKFAAEIAKSVL